MVDDSETAQTGGRKDATQERERRGAVRVSQGRVSGEQGDNSCTSAVRSDGVERLRSAKTREFKSNRMTVTSYYYYTVFFVARGKKECY